MFKRRKSPSLSDLGIDFNDWRLQPVKDVLRYGSRRDGLRTLRGIFPELGKRDAQAAVKAIQQQMEQAGESAPAPPVFTSDPTTIDLNRPEYEPVRNLLATNNKIGAIKALRRITNLGLKEAKQVVDGYNLPPGYSPPTQQSYNPATVDLNASEFAPVRAEIARGRKIEAIKVLRQIGNLSLKESKDLVEAYMAQPGGSPPLSASDLTAARRVYSASQVDLNDPQYAEVREYIRQGKKINAIKVLREITGLGLKESKDIVDRWM